MSSPTRSNDQQKTFALLLCLFLAYLYKEMVFDPYFHPQRPPAPQQAAAPQPVPTKAPGDEFAEPTSAVPAVSGAPAAPTATGAPVGTQPAVSAAPEQSAARYPTDSQITESGSVVIETEQLRAAISLLGGRVTELSLKNYKSAVGPDSPPLNLVEHVEFAPYPLGVYSGAVNDSWVRYQVVSGQTVSQKDQAVVNRVEAPSQSLLLLRGQLPDGREIKKALTFLGTGYLFDVDVELNGPTADGARLALEWTRRISKDNPSLLDPYNTSGYVWFDGQKALRESFAKLPGDQQDLPGIYWLTVADKYFMSTIIARGETALTGKILKTGELYRSRLSSGPVGGSFRMFVGPKSHRVLDEAGGEMKRNIDFGRTSIIALPLLQLLHVLHDVFGNYGLAIVMLTILVKLVLYPLNASSFKSMKALQDLAPEMKRIRETIEDKQQQQLATMQLYRDKKVNPLGGCWPIFLQMPVFIGLYSALLLDIELRHAHFAFWIHDLSAPEQLHLFGIRTPVLVILFVMSMLIQQWNTPSTVDPAQKRAMMFVPLVFGFMFAGMPAGLTLYWLTNNLISIGQQAGFRKDARPGAAFRMTLAIAFGVFALAFLAAKLG